MNRKFKYWFVIVFLAAAAGVVFWPDGGKDETVKHNDDRAGMAPIRKQSDRTRRSSALSFFERLAADPLKVPEHVDNRNELEAMIEMKEILRRDYTTPIDFWGKVVDQSGNPIGGVKVEIVIDGYDESRRHEVLSDGGGLFELLGENGARARVKVSLDGYAPTSEEQIGANISSRTIYYAEKVAPAYAPPSRENPQIFALRRKNMWANLGYSKESGVAVDKEGSPHEIRLKVEGKEIAVEVRCWSSCPNPFTYDKYDWRAEIRIEGGKLQAITELDPVSAPTNGYQEVFMLEMPKDTKENWIRSSPLGTSDHWIQFDDGTYAKAHIDVKTGRTHEVDVEVWYNLDGTNNFEQ